MHEVHVQSERASELARHLPDLRRNERCDPANVPVGTLCYEYPGGHEWELEQVAHVLGISYSWGGITISGTAIIQVIS